MYHRRAMVNPARVDRDDEKRMLPCRYFLSGFCQKGPRCKFFHPNMHVREPFIRVPDLPSSFTMVPQNGRLRGEGTSTSFGSQTRSRNGKSGWRTPIAGRTRSTTSVSPRSRRITEEMNGNILSPSSHAYSQYQTGTHLDDYYDEEDSDENGKPKTPEQKPEDQFTMFNHIDWSEFLAPGVAPPVPTEIPDQGAPLSPIRPGEMSSGSNMRARIIRPLLRVNNQDVPPEGLDKSGLPSMDSEGTSGERKLSAKEELQIKVKKIAQELKDEPIQHVRSLDSFFRNFKFNGYNVTAGPSSPGSARSFGPLEENDGNKENSQDISPRAGGSDSDDDNKMALNVNICQEDPSILVAQLSE